MIKKVSHLSEVRMAVAALMLEGHKGGIVKIMALGARDLTGHGHTIQGPQRGTTVSTACHKSHASATGSSRCVALQLKCAAVRNGCEAERDLL